MQNKKKATVLDSSKKKCEMIKLFLYQASKKIWTAFEVLESWRFDRIGKTNVLGCPDILFSKKQQWQQTNKQQQKKESYTKSLILIKFMRTKESVFTHVASIQQIYGNKIIFLHKKRVQLPQDLFETRIWPPWRHVNTLYTWNSTTWTAEKQEQTTTRKKQIIEAFTIFLFKLTVKHKENVVNHPKYEHSSESANLLINSRSI